MFSTIVFIGDSVTEGSFTSTPEGVMLTGLDDAQRFSRIIGTAKGYPTIINKGKSGDTVLGLKTRLAADVLPHMPALAVIMIGINNVATTTPTPVAEFRSDLEAVIDAIRSAGGDVVLLTPNVVRNTPAGQMFPDYLDCMTDVGRQKSIRVLPVYDLFARKWLSATSSEFDALFYDDKHPSAAGHAFIASLATSEPYSNVIPMAGPPAPTVKKIAFIGDSNTAIRPGNGINQAETFSQLVADARGFDQVINAGAGGQTSAQMLARFHADVLASGPCHVCIDAGINGVMSGQTPAQYEADIRAMVQACVDANVLVTLSTPWMVRTTAYIDAMPPFADKVRLVAADFGIPLVDVYFACIELHFMSNGDANFTTKYVDDQHQSVAGHAFRASLYAKAHNWRACSLPIA